MQVARRIMRWIGRHPWLGLALGAEIVLRLFFPGLRMFAYCAVKDEVPAWASEDRELFYAGFSSGSIGPRTFLLKHSHASPLIFNFGDSIGYGTINRTMPTGFGTLCGYNLFLQNALQYKLDLGHARVEYFGTGGYTTQQALILMKRVCTRVRPDLLIVCSATNDMVLASQTHKERLAENDRWRTRILHALYGSRLISLLGRGLLAWKPLPELPGGRLVPQVPVEDYRENLEAMAAYAERIGVPLILLSQPPLHEETKPLMDRYASVMAAVAAGHDTVHFVDVRAFFDALRARTGQAGLRPLPVIRIDRGGPLPVDIEAAYRYSDPLFSDGICHPSSLGYLLISDLLMETISAKHLLPFQSSYPGGDVLPLIDTPVS